MEDTKRAERNKRRRQNYAIANDAKKRAKTRKCNVQHELSVAENARQRKQSSREQITKKCVITRYARGSHYHT